MARNRRSTGSKSNGSTASKGYASGDINVQSSVNSSYLESYAARLPFTVPTGTTISDIARYTDAGIANDNWTMPGIMRIDFVPAYGWAQSSGDTINIAARQIYSYVRHANSGHTNYDAPDLMLYLMAMDSVYMFYQYMVKLYGSIHMFHQQNKYLGKQLVDSSGIPYTELISRLPDFLYYIKEFSVRASTLCVPNTMPIYADHLQLLTSYYFDADNVKAQIYSFHPEWLYRYNEFDGPGKLQGVDFHPETLDQLMSIGNSLLDAILVSEDMNIMSGDILKAYGEGNLVKIAPISDSYLTPMAYDVDILEMINNIVLAGETRYVPSIQQVVTDEDSYLTCGITTNLRYQGQDTAGQNARHTLLSNLKYLLNSRDYDVDPTRVMYITRGTSKPTLGREGNKTYLAHRHAGTEVFTRAWIFMYNSSSGTEVAPIIYTDTLFEKAAIEERNLNYFWRKCQFKDAPKSYIFLQTTDIDPEAIDDSSFKFIGIDSNLTNVFPAEQEDLERIHSARLLAAFGIPK